MHGTTTFALKYGQFVWSNCCKNIFHLKENRILCLYEKLLETWARSRMWKSVLHAVHNKNVAAWSGGVKLTAKLCVAVEEFLNVALASVLSNPSVVAPADATLFPAAATQRTRGWGVLPLSPASWIFIILENNLIFNL